MPEDTEHIANTAFTLCINNKQNYVHHYPPWFKVIGNNIHLKTIIFI